MWRAWKMLLTTGLLLLPFAVRGQTYDELSAMVTGPWHHLPNAVKPAQFSRDEAKCKVISAQTPITSTTPSIVERVRWTVQVNCLKASGYEPGNAPTKSISNESSSKLIDTRFEDYSCADIARLRKGNPAVDSFFFTWARGFISGWNASSAKGILKVDPAVLQPDEQLKFIRAFCEANPSKLYLAGVIELLAKLKYEKTRATGKADEE